MKRLTCLFLAAGVAVGAVTASAGGDLFQAVVSNRTEELSRSVAGGADVNAANENGWTPLMVAASRGNLEAIDLLLAAGADPGPAAPTRDVSGFTALMAAAYYGHPEAAAALLQAGAEPGATDNHYYGETALMLAVKRGDFQTVKVLLDGGADAGAANRAGVTALMYAASYGRLKIIKLLLAAGADAGVRDHSGLDALRWSVLAGSSRSAVRDLLRSPGD